jgi:hypothetical protein
MRNAPAKIDVLKNQIIPNSMVAQRPKITMMPTMGLKSPGRRQAFSFMITSSRKQYRSQKILGRSFQSRYKSGSG